MPVTTHNLITPATLARPAYLAPVLEPGYGTTLTRIAGDVGTVIPNIGGLWHSDARHGYSRRNPWNRDGSLAYIEQRGGTPSKLILDARTWKPLLGNTGNFRACTEVRWHPTQRTVMIGWNKSTLEIVVFDALNDTTIKRVKVGIAGVGLMGEGSLSNDGSMVALGDISNNVVLIDITNGRVSPVQKVDFIRATGHALGNCTISPLSTPGGGRFVAKASDTPELVHVYQYGSDLKLVHSFESDLTLSHADVGLTPAGREVFCGGARVWYGASGGFDKNNGNIAAIHLDTGEVMNVSAGQHLLGTKEAADQHCSLRGPRGWVLTTYAGAQETSGRFLMELVLWKLDGSRECVRFGVTRTNETGIYRAEAHGVCRPDGRAVMFASNWLHAANPVGISTDIKSFVYELTDVITPAPPPATLERFYVEPGWEYSPKGMIFDRMTGRMVTLTEVTRLLNGIKA